MSESGRRVTLVGDTDGFEAVVQEAGGILVSDDTTDLVVAVGEDAFVGTARKSPDAPILPVAVDDGRFTVAKPDAIEAISRAVRGAGSIETHPILEVSVDETTVDRAVLDVSLFTSEPARISEFKIHERGRQVDSVRADGVVVATPLGSDGYARAAGGPVVTAGCGLVVVPVAPFATQSDDWVLDDPITLSVEREEEAVTLFIDGETRTDVPPRTPLTITAIDSVSVLRLSDSDDR